MKLVTPSTWLLAVTGWFLLALGGLLPAPGGRIAHVLACVAFGVAVALVMIHGVATS